MGPCRGYPLTSNILDGDSGGPVLYEIKGDPQLYIVGVISSGEP